MSQRQWKRLDAVERIGRGTLTQREAAEVLGLSLRQVRRLRRAVERRGAKGVVHGNTGQAPPHRIAEAVREQIVELLRKKYAGFNDQHFTEKLCEVEGVTISRPSVQRLQGRRLSVALSRDLRAVQRSLPRRAGARRRPHARHPGARRPEYAGRHT